MCTRCRLQHPWTQRHQTRPKGHWVASEILRQKVLLQHLALFRHHSQRMCCRLLKSTRCFKSVPQPRMPPQAQETASCHEVPMMFRRRHIKVPLMQCKVRFPAGRKQSQRQMRTSRQEGPAPHREGEQSPPLRGGRVQSWRVGSQSLRKPRQGQLHSYTPWRRSPRDRKSRHCQRQSSRVFHQPKSSHCHQRRNYHCHRQRSRHCHQHRN